MDFVFAASESNVDGSPSCCRGDGSDGIVILACAVVSAVVSRWTVVNSEVVKSGVLSCSGIWVG